MRPHRDNTQTDTSVIIAEVMGRADKDENEEADDDHVDDEGKGSARDS